MLNYSEKGIRKLLENAGSWTEKVLSDEKIHEYFDRIAKKPRAVWKSDNKTLLDELDSRLRGYRDEAAVQSQVVTWRRHRAVK
jgi:hypothetical protein